MNLSDLILEEMEAETKDKSRRQLVRSLVEAGISKELAYRLGAIITTIVSWVRITAVAATPVGWVIGVAALGAAASTRTRVFGLLTFH